MTTTLQDKITLAKSVIIQTFVQFKRPCVLFSGGRDSTVLLHLLRSMGHHLPVICWREPWLPVKQKFLNEIIQLWQLEVYDYAPSRVQLCEGNGRLDVLNYYQTGTNQSPDYLMLARGTDPIKNGPWICGVDTFLSRPLGSFNFIWDVMFHGHKSCDVDPTSGKIPLEVDIFHRPSAASASYPLRHWEDTDVFAYIEEFGLPYDTTRYERSAAGEWKVIEEHSPENPDYYQACFECCKKSSPAFVHCPKLDVDINNISGQLSWADPQAEYCNLRTNGE